jgi:hypothetical protein
VKKATPLTPGLLSIKNTGQNEGGGASVNEIREHFLEDNYCEESRSHSHRSFLKIN